MKRLFIITAILLGSFAVSSAQTVKKDSTGNYITLKKEAVEKNTGKTFTDSKGNVYPVFESENGKLYIKRTAKTSGKEYKSYIKVQEG